MTFGEILPKGYCHDCQIKRGAVPPKWNPEMRGITVAEGICKDCKEKTGIVPSSDYDWPKEKKKAIWD